MSQVKDKQNSAGSARSIVLYSQNCGAAYTTVSWVHWITTNYCPLKFCTPDRLSLAGYIWLAGDSGSLWFLSGTPSDPNYEGLHTPLAPQWC